MPVVQKAIQGSGLTKLRSSVTSSDGTTEWSTGVPVVRRTTTKRTGKEDKGKAWFRDTPPVDVEGDWEFLKTVNETRRDGKSYTQTEEWTGAKEWDHDLYPMS